MADVAAVLRGASEEEATEGLDIVCSYSKIIVNLPGGRRKMRMGELVDEVEEIMRRLNNDELGRFREIGAAMHTDWAAMDEAAQMGLISIYKTCGDSAEEIVATHLRVVGELIGR